MGCALEETVRSQSLFKSLDKKVNNCDSMSIVKLYCHFGVGRKDFGQRGHNGLFDVQ